MNLRVFTGLTPAESARPYPPPPGPAAGGSRPGPETRLAYGFTIFLEFL
nr:MAG TPA: hypothetical protein [Caudoviricetes sp.]